MAIFNKLKCILSTDRLALILQAGDESRILKARSIREVFKTIVPYLSTSYKAELSYDSMRSKSYVLEESAKEIAVKTLERIIKHIKEYYRIKNFRIVFAVIWTLYSEKKVP